MRFFFFFLVWVNCHNFRFKKKLDKFVLKIWISRKVSYFVGILRPSAYKARVGGVFP